MARMHSRDKGKSGSKKPLSKSPPTWMSYKKDTVEQLITKLAKQGLNSSTIGLILRDTYGIPDTEIVTGKKISKILKEQKLSPELPEDLQNLIKKQVKITKHLEGNKKDMSSKRGLQLTESKIRRLVKYYKVKGTLPKGWKFDASRARLIVG